MRFYVSSAFLESREVVEIARAADELGYDGMGIPDHVVNLETLQTPFCAGPQASLAEKIDGMERFRKDLGLEGQ